MEAKTGLDDLKTADVNPLSPGFYFREALKWLWVERRI